MKKTVSFILLISLLLSLLIFPVSAESTYVDPYAGRTNVALKAFMAGGNGTGGWFNFKGVSGSNNITDGVKSHEHSNSKTFLNLMTRATAAQLKAGTAALFDINGKTGDAALGEQKYLGIVGYRLTGTYTIDAVRVFLDEVNGGEPCEHMLDGLDVAVSTTGEDGSWTVVYSGSNINCEKNYKIYEDAEGNQTAYVDARFAPVEARYFRVGVTATSCLHTETPVDDGNLPWCRITEVELFKHIELDNTTRKNVALGAFMAGGNGTGGWFNFKGVSGSNNITDGVKSHEHSNSKTFLNLMTRATAAQLKAGTAALFDINGKTGDAALGEQKYLGIVGYRLTGTHTVEAVRVYLDEINGGEPCEHMLDGLDVAVSETGEAGSWTVVYSGSNINCEKNYRVYEDENGNQTAYVEAVFEPIKARYFRVGVSATSCLHTETPVDDGNLPWCRITEVELWSLPVEPEEDGDKSDDTAIKSTMLFPLLMRHRQYETETSTTMFGLRVKHLLRSADAITFEKNGIKVDIPAATLEALDLAGSDKLVVTITGTDSENAKVTVTVNGKAVDIEGIASAAPDEPEEEKGTTYRWDFNDLTEANGKNNLTDSAKSAKEYSFENGCIVLTGDDTDFKLEKSISLSKWSDWSIEWRAKLEKNSALFGAAASNQNFVYLAYQVSGWNLPFRMVSSNNKASMIRYGDYANLNNEMNTWKAEYDSDADTVTLKYYNETTEAWEVVGSVSPSDMSFELTHMFGRYGDEAVHVCLKGVVDYIEVFVAD